MKNIRAVIIPDCHIPFHDIRAYNLVLGVAEDIGIDELYLTGDFADFYNLSQHGPKDPGIFQTLEDEIFEVNKKLKELNNRFKNVKKTYVMGNHEYRLDRFITNKCPEFFGVVGIEKILYLDHYGFEYIPYGPYQSVSIGGTDLLLRHEPLSNGKHVAKPTIEKASASVAFGHTHRLEMSYNTTMDGRELVGISCGWLGDKTNPIFNYIKNFHNWQHGFLVVDIVNGVPYYQLVHIKNYKCVVNGFLYSG